jgi:hypothetical protein
MNNFLRFVTLGVFILATAAPSFRNGNGDVFGMDVESGEQ